MAQGVRLLEAAAALAPNDPNTLYNLACAQALAQQQEKALVTLRHAVARGFRDVDHIQQDPDLASLRDTPAYQQITRQLRQQDLDADE